jgi:hypothetical protein
MSSINDDFSNFMHNRRRGQTTNASGNREQNVFTSAAPAAYAPPQEVYTQSAAPSQVSQVKTQMVPIYTQPAPPKTFPMPAKAAFSGPANIIYATAPVPKQVVAAPTKNINATAPISRQVVAASSTKESNSAYIMELKKKAGTMNYLVATRNPKNDGIFKRIAVPYPLTAAYRTTLSEDFHKIFNDNYGLRKNTAAFFEGIRQYATSDKVLFESNCSAFGVVTYLVSLHLHQIIRCDNELILLLCALIIQTNDQKLPYYSISDCIDEYSFCSKIQGETERVKEYRRILSTQEDETRTYELLKECGAIFNPFKERRFTVAAPITLDDCISMLVTQNKKEEINPKKMFDLMQKIKAYANMAMSFYEEYKKKIIEEFSAVVGRDMEKKKQRYIDDIVKNFLWSFVTKTYAQEVDVEFIAIRQQAVNNFISEAYGMENIAFHMKSVNKSRISEIILLQKDFNSRTRKIPKNKNNMNINDPIFMNTNISAFIDTEIRDLKFAISHVDERVIGKKIEDVIDRLDQGSNFIKGCLDYFKNSFYQDSWFGRMLTGANRTYWLQIWFSLLSHEMIEVTVEFSKIERTEKQDLTIMSLKDIITGITHPYIVLQHIPINNKSCKAMIEWLNVNLNQHLLGGYDDHIITRMVGKKKEDIRCDKESVKLFPLSSVLADLEKQNNPLAKYLLDALKEQDCARIMFSLANNLFNDAESNWGFLGISGLHKHCRQYYRKKKTETYRDFLFMKMENTEKDIMSVLKRMAYLLVEIEENLEETEIEEMVEFGTEELICHLMKYIEDSIKKMMCQYFDAEEKKEPIVFADMAKQYNWGRFFVILKQHKRTAKKAQEIEVFLKKAINQDGKKTSEFLLSEKNNWV